MSGPVLAIGAGWEQERLLAAARARGRGLVATAWPSTYADALPMASVGAVVDPRDLAGIWAFAREHRPSAVVADQCDYSYFATAFVAERLGLPGPTLASAHVATNKYRQRQRLAAADAVAQPRYRLCRTLTEVREALNEVKYPAILKPLDNRGNFGVNRVDEPVQVPDAYYEALTHSHTRELLVEEFVDGTMTTVEGFRFPAEHVSLVASSKRMLGGRKRVAMELQYPALLDDHVVRDLMETNQRVMAALGYGVGPTHAEYMVTPDGRPFFIEAANRGGGVLINSHIVPALTAVDPTQLLLDHALGLEVPTARPRPATGAAVLSFFGFDTTGTVQGFDGVDEARTLPGVLALRLMVSAGATIQPIVTDAHRHGFVIVNAPTIDAARRTVETIRELVRVRVA